MSVSIVIALLALASQSQAPTSLTVRRDLLVDPATADLSNAFNMAVSPRGEIVMGQTNDGQIKVFSPTGAARVIGRRGEGPGEFRRVTRVGFKGDTLWALDPNTSRISFFSPDYKFVRSMFEPSSQEKAASELFVQAVLPNGDLRVIVGFLSNAPRPKFALGSDSGSTVFARVSPAGVVRRSIAILPPSLCRVSRATGSMISTRAIPFCAEALRTDWDGSLGLAFVEVAGTKYRVTAIDANDDTLFSRSYEFNPIPVSKGALDSLAEREVEIKRITSPADWAARPKVSPVKSFPPIRSLLLGRDNTVWLELRTTTGGHHWLMLDRKGMPVGSFVVPNEVTLKVAERGTVWGLITDEDGLTGIVRYRVTGH